MTMKYDDEINTDNNSDIDIDNYEENDNNTKRYKNAFEHEPNTGVENGYAKTSQFFSIELN